MIVEFSVKNFRSIKDLQTISFVPTGLKSSPAHTQVDANNIGSEGDHKLLKTIGIYGANGSGKSNVIRALDYFIKAISNEPSSESNLKSLCDPFLYQSSEHESGSFFQIVLIINNKKYRYGFTVRKNTTIIPNDENKSKEIISSEWLYGTKEKNTSFIFIRKNIDEVEKENLPESQNIPALAYEHTLFLTHASAFDSQGVCASIRLFFRNWTISNIDGFLNFRRNSIRVIEIEKKKDNFLQLLASFNLKYNDVIFEEDPNKEKGGVLSHEKIFLTKSYVNDENSEREIRLNLGYNESAGTQKLFDIAGLLLRAFNLEFSALIILDEVDSNFHPSLLIKLIELFNNPLINKSNSQLIFTSHDTNLMAPDLMRRDQFYFTEKKEDESTRLYSLADLRGIRNDADFSKQYLAGFYGALPILSTYKNESVNRNDGSVEFKAN